MIQEFILETPPIEVLFQEQFWTEKFSISPQANTPPQESLNWQTLPQEIKVLFLNDPVFLNFWLQTIDTKKYEKFFDLYDDENLGDMFNLVKNDGTYKEQIKSREKFESDVKSLFNGMQQSEGLTLIKQIDQLLLDFFKDTQENELLLLSTDLFYMLGGKNKKKVAATKKQFKKQFNSSPIHSLTISSKIKGSRKKIDLPIYIFKRIDGDNQL